MKNGYSQESPRRETVKNAIKKGHLDHHVRVGYTPSDKQIFSHLTSLTGAGPHLTNGVDSNSTITFDPGRNFPKALYYIVTPIEGNKSIERFWSRKHILMRNSEK
jgi:hypothetical protein